MEQGELESSPYSRRYSRSPEAELSLHDDDSRISGDDRKHSDEDLDHHDTDHDHRRPDSEDERRSDGRRNSHSGDEVEILDSPADRFRILFFILDLFNFLKHCYFASMDCMWGGGGSFKEKKGIMCYRSLSVCLSGSISPSTPTLLILESPNLYE